VLVSTGFGANRLGGPEEAIAAESIVQWVVNPGMEVDMCLHMLISLLWKEPTRLSRYM